MNASDKEEMAERELLPIPRQWVILGTNSARRVGYLDTNGNWRDVVHDGLVDNVQNWTGFRTKNAWLLCDSPSPLKISPPVKNKK